MSKIKDSVSCAFSKWQISVDENYGVVIDFDHWPNAGSIVLHDASKDEFRKLGEMFLKLSEEEDSKELGELFLKMDKASKKRKNAKRLKK